MQNNSCSLRQRYTPQQRERLVAKYQASGLTQREFARQNGVNLRSFQQWLYRPDSGRRRVQPKPVFQELSFSEVPFLERWTAELGLPSGMVLRLKPQASTEWVGALVERLS